MDVEAMAKEHKAGMRIVEIAKKYRIAPKTLIRRLREFSKKSDWYSYEAAKKNNMSNANKKKVVDSLSARVYLNFIKTFKSLGYTEIEIWEKIREIENGRMEV